jgi:hypothetical protein
MILQELSDEELLKLYDKESRSMSFFNAAEGQSWYQESSARDACRIRRGEVISECKSRGVELPVGNYLC